MRSWFRRAVTLALALLICVPALATDALAWEKEQQALNDVMEQDDTLFAPIDVNLPAIAKMVEGENAPNERFTFILKGKSGAPMPEGAAGSRYRVSRVGKGLVSLGSITFEQSGIYVYTIYEMASDDPNWTYDDSEYTLTIKVKKDGEVLTAETALTKDGKSAKKIVFTNTYKKIDLTEKVTISGQKIWNHGTNPEENQPDHIIVMIYADGILNRQKEVTERSDWKYSFVLPKYNNSGKEIRYTVDEAGVTDYSKKISGYDITNTYTGHSSPTQPSDPSTPGTDPSKPSTPGKPPKTGDEFPLTLWLILGAVGLCGFAAMLVALHRTKHADQGGPTKGKGKRLMKKRGQGA